MLWQTCLTFATAQGLILHGGNDFLGALHFPHRVPLTKEKMPWCPCPFKNGAYRPDSYLQLFVYQLHSAVSIENKSWFQVPNTLANVHFISGSFGYKRAHFLGVCVMTNSLRTNWHNSYPNISITQRCANEEYFKKILEFVKYKMCKELPNIHL